MGLPVVVAPVLCHCCLSTLWTMHELEWPTTPNPRAASDSSTVSSTSTRRPLPLTASPVSTVAGLGGYPIDTVRRRMMMTSGGGVKYNGSIDCFAQVVKNEGVGSLFKGAGANIMRGMGGAAVLAFCDVFKDAYIAWKKSN